MASMAPMTKIARRRRKRPQMIKLPNRRVHFEPRITMNFWFEFFFLRRGCWCKGNFCRDKGPLAPIMLVNINKEKINIETKIELLFLFEVDILFQEKFYYR